MDEFLTRLGVQAANYAMRCGIALTSTFALQQCSRLLKTVDDKAQQAELHALQKTLDSKIKAGRSGRGNAFLENAATLARALHRDIVALGRQLENTAAAEEELAHTATRRFRTKAERHTQVAAVISEVRRLLARIDGDIPLLQLAITASGESLTAALPPSISPSRLLQASMLLTVGDTQFTSRPPRQPVQIGPAFTLSLYMLFLGHSAAVTTRYNPQPAVRSEEEERLVAPVYGLGEGERKPIWQEVLHKARVRLCRTLPGWELDGELGCRSRPRPQQPSPIPVGHSRVPRSVNVAPYLQQDTYAYHLEIIEDLDDGRAHEDDEDQQQQQKPTYDGVRQAGIREAIPIYQVSKIFYADTGRILNIGPADGGQNNSVLLLKRDMAAPAPTRTMEHMEPTDDEQDGVDRQLQEETNSAVAPAESSRHSTLPQCESQRVRQPSSRRFPGHLDPEWLALEVFAEDEDDDDSDDDDDVGYGDHERDMQQDAGSQGSGTARSETPTASAADRPVDVHLLEQFRNLAAPSAPGDSRADIAPASAADPASSAAQSPFGVVTTSLSLLEMLVRLTSLQEFQQTSHLAIPDHILTFFLEETSTTGLRGDARWQAKQAARRRVGFDPYTDTPTK